jgi:hypothetical protein
VKEVRVIDEQTADPEKLQVGHLNEHKETERLESAAEHISQIEQLRPEAWAKLTETQREWRLREVGQRLAEAYECPAPPFIGARFKGDGTSITHGNHSDSDYLTKVNRETLMMDDSGKALETYCHEFRHAYQHEMASRYDSGYMHWREYQHLQEPHAKTLSETEGHSNSPFKHLCHDEAKASQWAENLRPGNYITFEMNRDQYAEQPVEADARDFARKIREAVRNRQAV